MTLRTGNTPWVFGVLGALLLVAVACGSSAPDDGDASRALAAGSNSSGSGDTGVLVTETGAAEAGEPTIWFGAHTTAVPEILAGLLGLPAGERVAWVTPGGPADGALVLGDTITALDGEALDAGGGLAAMLASRTPGESVTLTVIRGGEGLEVPITLEAKPAHEPAGNLAEIQGLFDRAISGELRFLDSAGGEHAASFASGTLSGVNDGRVTLARPGSGPATVTLSPNVFVWIDGSPGTTEDLASATGGAAKVVSLDDEALAVLVGGVVPPALEALEGLLGSDGEGLLGALGALESLQGLFGAADASSGDPGL